MVTRGEVGEDGSPSQEREDAETAGRREAADSQPESREKAELGYSNFAALRLRL
jgi:hypothetical protein